MTVKTTGVPQAGKTVNFSIADSSRASVSPNSAVTDANGQAQVTVRGKSQFPNETTLKATANGASDTVTVRVPDLSPTVVGLLMACFVLGVILHRRSAPHHR